MFMQTESCRNCCSDCLLLERMGLMHSGFELFPSWWGREGRGWNVVRDKEDESQG